eukprot:scaffold82962_cov18-Tisochrysis_lutea.AAC.1
MKPLASNYCVRFYGPLHRYSLAAAEHWLQQTLVAEEYWLQKIIGCRRVLVAEEHWLQRSIGSAKHF